MPELEQRIRGVVRSELDAHRDALAELVDAELERIVSELVAERLASTNVAARVGAKPYEPERAGPETSVRDETPPAALEELCRECGVEPRLPGRRIGSRCKGKRDHARAIARKRGKAAGAAESDSEPRPAPESDPEPAGAPVRFAKTQATSESRAAAARAANDRRERNERADRERIRAVIVAAEPELVERDGRTFELRRLPDPGEPLDDVDELDLGPTEPRRAELRSRLGSGRRIA